MADLLRGGALLVFPYARGATLELVATTRSLPSLQEFCFGGGPARTDPAWDRALAASFPVYLHGTRVTAEYPQRT